MTNLASTMTATPEPPNLREAMRLAANTVCVVTAGFGEDRTGLTVNSAVSLSMDPQTMIVSVNRSSSSLPVIRRYRHFCVNLLNTEQAFIAERFAGRDGKRGVDRYDGAEWHPLETGALALSSSLASVDCVLDEIVERHSHAILIGSVSAIRVGEGTPLLYLNGAFGRFSAN